MKAADDLFDWLVDGAPGATQSTDIVERIGRDLAAAGLPIDRVHVFVTTLHPTVLGRQFRWSIDEPVRTLELTLAIQQTAAFAQSPLIPVTKSRTEVRRNLEGVLAKDDFGVLHDLKKEGFTDYLCAPLPFVSGETHAATFATRAKRGFSDEHLATIRRILRPLARVAEIYALQRVASNLLSTYVGRNSGDRILSGRIMRGDMETLRAVIWFSDLRGFTSMSARLPPRAIIDLLNELFDCQVPAIEKHGGEVLKFIGDGLLGIFPFDDDLDVRAGDALAAANDAFMALDARNAAAPEPIRFGLALHVGEVAYGNIGGASRLDFTAIGPAVNVAARLEGLTGKLDRRIVVSSELAARVRVALEDLGTFELKGVPDEQRVFAVCAIS
ncbi:MAG TPA: adenylate/guanylate cyclase domain-containing protein [Polyangiaceae bacterium]|nr:adenylate/guanylate cyclase domain-containing protein [Polyangiaceae bacterium]